MGWIPVEFWHHLVSQNLKTLIFLFFSQYPSWGVGSNKKSIDLPTSPINQFRDYFIRNRIEKLVPVNYRFPTGNKKTSKKRPNRFQTLPFGRNLGFQKSGIHVYGILVGGNGGK